MVILINEMLLRYYRGFEVKGSSSDWRSINLK